MWVIVDFKVNKRIFECNKKVSCELSINKIFKIKNVKSVRKKPMKKYTISQKSTITSNFIIYH